VVARVTLKRPEDDLDYHLVLRSGARAMIAETPSPLCTSGATALRRTQMQARGGSRGSALELGWLASASSTTTTARRALRRTRSSSTRFFGSPASH